KGGKMLVFQTRIRSEAVAVGDNWARPRPRHTRHQGEKSPKGQSDAGSLASRYSSRQRRQHRSPPALNLRGFRGLVRNGEDDVPAATPETAYVCTAPSVERRAESKAELAPVAAVPSSSLANQVFNERTNVEYIPEDAKPSTKRLQAKRMRVQLVLQP
ncbi:hypothetical protein THAOC_34580, partial [Thalassiosira oceanica]